MSTLDFIGKIVINLVIAGLATSSVVIILALIFGNLGLLQSMTPQINATGGIIFGAIFGYRLNSLLRKKR